MYEPPHCSAICAPPHFSAACTPSLLFYVFTPSVYICVYVPPSWLRCVHPLNTSMFSCVYPSLLSYVCTPHCSVPSVCIPSHICGIYQKSCAFGHLLIRKVRISSLEWQLNSWLHESLVASLQESQLWRLTYIWTKKGNEGMNTQLSYEGTHSRPMRVHTQLGKRGWTHSRTMRWCTHSWSRGDEHIA